MQVRGTKAMNIITNRLILPPLRFDYCVAQWWKFATIVLHRAFTEQEIQLTSTKVVHSLSGIISDALNQLLGIVPVSGSSPQ